MEVANVVPAHVLKADLPSQVSAVMMEPEFQQDFDIRDCAAIKVSTNSKISIKNKIPGLTPGLRDRVHA
jgi:hypothetical protein